MGKVQILAVLTMDGCLSSELYYKAHQDLCLDRCGLDEIRKNALYRVTPDYSISMLHEWRKDGTNIRYLAEATPDTADYINSLPCPVWLPRGNGCLCSLFSIRAALKWNSPVSHGKRLSS